MRDHSSGLAREQIRAVNTRAILDAIHQEGQISRTDLAAQVGLSQAAVTDITASLVRSGLVFEAREGESGAVGRKPILLQIDYDSASVLGVKVTNSFVTGVLTNLRTDVLATFEEPLPDHQPETVLSAITRSVERLRATPGPPAPMAGAAVTLPGIVDPKTGTHVYSALLGWQDLPLSDLIEARIGVPVFVDNDVNALAAAEASFGQGRDHGSFLVVTLGRGVGLGIVLDGDVFRGQRGGAGEFGHVCIDPHGPVCSCGNRGCLEAFISDDALLTAARAAGMKPTDPADLVRLADRGEEAATELFASAGQKLGLGLSQLVNIFAPTLIVLGGEGMRAASHIMPAASEAISRHAFGNLADDLRLGVETWGDDAWARGAAGLAASRYLQEVAWQLEDHGTDAAVPQPGEVRKRRR